VHRVTKTADEVSSARCLSIYLNDHLAGSTGVIELVRRAAREHEGTALGSFLSRLAVEIAEDRQALRRVMAAAGARPRVAKVAFAWLAEKAGRLKFNGRLLSRSPLSPFIELEAAEIGIYGKLLLWQVLRDQRPAGSGAVDLEELITRAQRQLAEVETHRAAASSALSLGGPPTSTVVRQLRPE
jgi:hypothetical protein